MRFLLWLCLCACSRPEPPAPAPVPPAASFADVAASSGLVFRHENGASPQKYFPETMAGGGAFLDYDMDGHLDIYLVNGTPLAAPPPSPPPLNALFRNQGDGTFAEVGAAAGVAHSGFGMGVTWGDVDNDSDPDLYVTNYGPDVFFRNQGDGTFEERTAEAGLGNPRWGSSAAFADFDRDGDLDLYVANYVDYELSQAETETIPYMAGHESYAGKAPRGYPHPANFQGAPDLLYRNEGNGTFADITRAAGVYDENGKGLGVVWSDGDGDGWPDLYVANDAVRNFLYRNQGDGTFEERAAAAGVAYGQDGQMEAGMGVDWADYDNDGRPDLTVTNFQGEPNALYHNEGNGFFSVETFSSGTGLVSLPFLGFGTFFFDYDADADADLFVANGHVLDNVEQIDRSTAYAQRNLLFRNDGPGAFGKVRFAEVGLSAGSGMLLEQVSRGAASGDYDNDGDLDVLVINLGQEAALLRNDGGQTNHWLGLKLVGAQSNRDAVGARARLWAGNALQMREVRTGYSYLAQGDMRLYFGLGARSRADSLEIRWPSGRLERFADLGADAYFTIVEGEGLRDSMKPSK